MQLFIVLVVVLTLMTVLYKVAPHRELGQKKPRLAFFPKYKHKVLKPDSDYRVDEIMCSLGFKKKGRGELSQYSRGSIVGDISVKQMKVKVSFYPSGDGSLLYAVEAAWVVAFDTGDHWLLTKALGDALENSSH